MGFVAPLELAGGTVTFGDDTRQRGRFDDIKQLREHEYDTVATAAAILPSELVQGGVL